MIDNDLAKDVLESFVKKGWSLGSVESLTGGLFSSTICSIPGASRVYKGSIISYANEVKENLAHVKDETIRTYGVVSKEVAEEMALGGLEALNVNVAVSFTGNAGPTASGEGCRLKRQRSQPHGGYRRAPFTRTRSIGDAQSCYPVIH